MNKCETIGAMIGSFAGCIVAAVFNVFVVPSIWFAALPFIGYLMGGWIG